LPYAWIGIGSNVGDREGYVRQALGALAAVPGTEVTGVSSLYETAPVGMTEQERFINAVAELTTEIPPLDLMRRLLAIEKENGRERWERWAPRTLDLDLLIYEDVEMESQELTLPHPRARGRAFVLVPLAEVAPELRFPGDSVTVARIVEGLGDLGDYVRAVDGPPEEPLPERPAGS